MLDRKRLAVYLGSFIGPLSGNAVLALIPTLKTAFDASAPEVLLSISFFMIPFAFFTLFSGAISDVYDRKKTVLVGFVVYAVGSLMCALSWNLGFFLLSRTVQGLGYGFVSPVMVAILGDIVPFEERGKSMGYLGAATTGGIALGPFVAGFIAILDWRLVFVFIAALILLIGVFFNFEFRGVAFPRGQKGARSVLGNLKSGIMDKSVLVLSLAGFLTFMCYISALSFMSDNLSLPPLFLSESEIGTVMAATGIAGIFAAPVGGRLADKLGRFTTATIGYVIVIGAFILLGLSSTTFGFVGSLAVLGIGTAVVWAPLLTLTVEVQPSKRGTTSSLFNGARFFGYAMAPLIFAPVYTASGIEAIYLSSIAIAAVAAVAVLSIKPMVKARAPPSPIGPGSP